MTGIGQPNMRLRSALFSALAYLADCVQGAENAARARASPSPRDECFPAHAQPIGQPTMVRACARTVRACIRRCR